MRILVLGASGRVGKLVCSEAVARGHTVIGLVRNKPLEEVEGVVYMLGDARNLTNLLEPMKKCDAVIYCIANKLTQPVNNLYSETTRTLIKAMEQGGVKRIVWLTGFTGMTRSMKEIPLFQRIAFLLPPFNEIYKDKFLAENLLYNSPLNYTRVECLFMNDAHPIYPYSSATSFSYRWWQFLSTARIHAASALVDEVEKNNSYHRIVVWSQAKQQQ